MKDDEDIRPLYSSCSLCPRQCHVNRSIGEKGFCRESDVIRVACAGLHHGEEPVISGKNGSGTVFFTGCTLMCRFCQNYQISSCGIGSHITVNDCAEIFLTLQSLGAENINLVTGTQFIPGIICAIKQAKKSGLTIPLLWNSSGYEEVRSLKILEPYIDIWVPDIKTLNLSVSKKIFDCRDYPEKVKEALFYLKNNTTTRIQNRIMKNGIIVRHLVLPGAVSSTKEVLAWYKQYLAPDVILSVMFQFIPLEKQNCFTKTDFPGYVTKREYEEVFNYLDKLGIDEGFIQEPVQETAWIPDFYRENPFPVDFAVPVWHYSKGFIS